jgi:hypothetical protein
MFIIYTPSSTVNMQKNEITNRAVDETWSSTKSRAKAAAWTQGGELWIWASGQSPAY